MIQRGLIPKHLAAKPIRHSALDDVTPRACIDTSTAGSAKSVFDKATVPLTFPTMTRNFPVTLLALLVLVFATTLQAQPSGTDPSSTAKPTTEKTTPRELSTLDFDEAKNGFIDPESRELYTGPMVITYPSGQLETDGGLADGLEDGSFIEYYADGTKSGMGSYQAGLEVGPWTYWWENGRIESEGAFKNGQLDGVWSDYHPSGKLARKGEYVNGLAQGKWSVAEDDGGNAVEIYYDKGEEVTPPDDNKVGTNSNPTTEEKAVTTPDEVASPPIASETETVEETVTPLPTGASPNPAP